MQAATVAILVSKAQFKHETAVAIAEAIDVEIAGAEFVTVPVLDVRLATLKARIQAEFQEFKAEMQADFQEFKAEMQAQFQKFKAEMQTDFQEFKAEVQGQIKELRNEVQELRNEIQELRNEINELRAYIQEVKAELVRWVFVVMIGNAAISAATMALVNALQHGH